MNILMYLLSQMKKKSMIQSSIGPVIIDLIEELEIELEQEMSSVKSFKPKPVFSMTAQTESSITSISDEKLQTETKSTSVNTIPAIKIKSLSSVQVIKISRISNCLSWNKNPVTWFNMYFLLRSIRLNLRAMKRVLCISRHRSHIHLLILRAANCRIRHRRSKH